MLTAQWNDLSSAWGKTSEGQTVIYILETSMTCWVPPLLLLLLHGDQLGVDCLPQGQASPAGGQGGEVALRGLA